MLKAASGRFDDNPVKYINVQLMYYLGLTPQYIDGLTDGDWAEHYAILENIRTEQAKRQPFAN